MFVDTDAGITGISEVSGAFRRRRALLRNDLERGLVPAVIGKDPLRIAYLVQKMDLPLDRFGTALWDIVGNALGAPVYGVLGHNARGCIPLNNSVPFGEPKQIAEFVHKRV